MTALKLLYCGDEWLAYEMRKTAFTMRNLSM